MNELINIERPKISSFDDPVEFMTQMLVYLKKTHKGFSVLKATSVLRKISPALVTLILQKRRKLTEDRVEEFSKLLRLNSAEKSLFRRKVEEKTGLAITGPIESLKTSPRKSVPVGILNDWLNVYVKDFFQLKEVQKKPELIYSYLAGVATATRIQKSIKFLLREGHLRKTLDERIVLETNLSIAEPNVPSEKIRKFHKGAFKLASRALDLYPTHERYANTVVLNLNEKSYEELKGLIEDFGEKIKDFIENEDHNGSCIYQLIINLSPVGGNSNV